MARPHWLALLPGCNELPAASAEAGGTAGDAASPPPDQQRLAWWALQFTPRVALLEEAVLLELSGSLRLFGGLRSLHARLKAETASWGLRGLAWAPGSLAALALARAGQVNGISRPLAPLLDALPLSSLSAVQAQAPMLARLGCRRLGDVRRLPRGPAARRFGTELLQALDQAYGELPQAHDWVQLPERFESRLELPFRVDQAQALQVHAELLLRRCCDWLAERHAGIRELQLHWQHDAMRARDCAAEGGLRLGFGDCTRHFPHLARLLAEQLARSTLPAPVGELRLVAEGIEPMPEHSASLLPHSAEQAREPLSLLLTRLSLRLGESQVLAAQHQADHRPEAMQRWRPWARLLPRSPSATQGTPALPRELPPQPSWLLDPPLRLLTRQSRPLYMGELQLLLGPQRVEGGWWGWPDGHTPAEAPAPHVQRDYYLARNAQAGLLWIFQERLGGTPLATADVAGGKEGGARWFLHGVFA